MDPQAGVLTKHGTPIRLPPQPFQLLCLLVENAGQLVTREELRARLWPDTFVDFDLAMNTAVRRIRVVLSDSVENPRFIETLPKRGYRFVAPVERIATPQHELAVTQPPVSDSSTRRTTSRLAAGIAICILAAAAWWAYTYAQRHVGSSVTSIAVLPFVNRSNDASLDYLANGLSESLIGSLSELSSLRVMASGTTATFKGRDVDPRTAGRELHVAAVVRGSLSHQGETLVVDADLIDTAEGTEIWHGSYRRPLGADLELEREVSRALIAKLSCSRPSTQPHPPSHLSTTSNDAYQHYLKGLYNWRSLSKDTALTAVRHFEQAIELDPQYALPYVGMGATYQVLDDWVLPPAEAIPKARAALEKALDLDPSIGEAHTLLGTIHFWYDFDQAAAETEFQRAIGLSPGSDDAHMFYGWYLVSHNHCAEGLAEHHRAIELSPYDLNNRIGLIQSLYYCRRYDEALEELKATLPQNPNAWTVHEFLGWVYEELHQPSLAVAELTKATELEPAIAEPYAALAHAKALQGDRAAARSLLELLKQRAQRQHIPPYDFAMVLIGLGEKEQAIAQIEKAYQERSWFVTFLALDPKLDTLRSDARIQRVLAQSGLR